jgi:hypothetical protein
MTYEFSGPNAGPEYSWLVELASGPRTFHRHDVITGAEFEGASGETKRNIEGLVARGVLVAKEDTAEPAAPEPAPPQVTPDEPEKES